VDITSLEHSSYDGVPKRAREQQPHRQIDTSLTIDQQDGNGHAKRDCVGDDHAPHLRGRKASECNPD
jgi:hypothetical protein